MDGHRAHHQRHHGVGRNAQREQRNEGRLRAGVVGGFGTGDAFNRALAKAARILRDLLLDRVGGEGAKHGAIARQNAKQAADERAAQNGRRRLLDFSP